MQPEKHYRDMISAQAEWDQPLPEETDRLFRDAIRNPQRPMAPYRDVRREEA